MHISTSQILHVAIISHIYSSCQREGCPGGHSSAYPTSSFSHRYFLDTDLRVHRQLYQRWDHQAIAPKVYQPNRSIVIPVYTQMGVQGPTCVRRRAWA